MKRSEMIEDVTEFMNTTFPDDISWGKVDGSIILEFFEASGMLPPSIDLGATKWAKGHPRAVLINEWEDESPTNEPEAS